LKTPEEVEAGSPLFLDMVEDARILHDEDGFLAAYLEGLRQRLVALGSRRVWRGGTWHWVLKPDLKPGETITLCRVPTWPEATSPRRGPGSTPGRSSATVAAAPRPCGR